MTSSDPGSRSSRWRILNQYKEMRQEGERKARQKIKDNQRIRDLMKQNLSQDVVNALQTLNRSKELNNLIKKFTEDIKDRRIILESQAGQAQEDLQAKVDKAQEDLQAKVDKAQEDLQAKLTESIRQQTYNIKAYKNMEAELRKLQSFIIVIPLIIVAFSFFFGDRIKDIMLIDVLQTDVKHLQEDIKSLQQPNYYSQPQGPGIVCQPGDEACCSPDGFFSC